MAKITEALDELATHRQKIGDVALSADLVMFAKKVIDGTASNSDWVDAVNNLVTSAGQNTLLGTGVTVQTNAINFQYKVIVYSQDRDNFVKLGDMISSAMRVP